MPKKPGKGGHGPEEFDPVTGQYRSSEGSEGADATRSLVSKAIALGKYGPRIKATYDKGDDERKKELVSAIIKAMDKKKKDAEEAELNRDDREQVLFDRMEPSEYDSQNLTHEEKRQVFLNDSRFSRRALIEASEEDLDKLAKAMWLFNQKNKMADDDPEIAAIARDPDGMVAAGDIWRAAVTVQDYEALRDSGSIDSKRNYFENVYTGVDKQSKIDMLTKYELTGQRYLAKRAEKQIDDAPDREIMDRFSNKNNPYSWARKHRDAYYNEISDNTEAMLATDERYGVRTNELITGISLVNRNGYEMLKDYTKGFVWANDPLRGTPYSASGGSSIGVKNSRNWVQNVKDLTDALDMCSYDDDIWLTRYVNDLSDPATGFDISQYYGHLEDMVGMVFKDQGFVSSTGSKTTGHASFDNRSIVQHIYAPNGTHMLNMPTVANSDRNDWNDYSSQNEFLVQRGYSYRITKAYAKGGVTHIDVEVLLGTDAEKYDDQQLNAIRANLVR